MKKMLTASAVAAIVLALSVPAFAGGDHCSGGSSASASMSSSCSASAHSSAWSGAWLERSANGTVTVADVAKGSPAAKAGLKSGDVVLAVNGYDLSNCAERSACAAKASCKVGSSVIYTVNRTGKSKDIKLKLEKMPVDATERFAARSASFEPMFAAVVMPITAN
jgi:C-terminal processing protease CtpA/Prc